MSGKVPIPIRATEVASLFQRGVLTQYNPEPLFNSKQRGVHSKSPLMSSTNTPKKSSSPFANSERGAAISPPNAVRVDILPRSKSPVLRAFEESANVQDIYDDVPIHILESSESQPETFSPAFPAPVRPESFNMENPSRSVTKKVGSGSATKKLKIKSVSKSPFVIKNCDSDDVCSIDVHTNKTSGSVTKKSRSLSKSPFAIQVNVAETAYEEPASEGDLAPMYEDIYLDDDEVRNVRVLDRSEQLHDLYVIGCPGDGSCFYHAILKAVNPRYQKERDQDIRDSYVHEFRSAIASALAVKNRAGKTLYSAISNGHFVTLAAMGPIDVGDDPEPIKYGLGDLQKEIANPVKYAGDYILPIISALLGIDVYVVWYNSQSGHAVPYTRSLYSESAPQKSEKFEFGIRRSKSETPAVVLAFHDMHYDLIAHAEENGLATVFPQNHPLIKNL
jgi:hypothetical protein